jgi:hypothetical protein
MAKTKSTRCVGAVRTDAADGGYGMMSIWTRALYLVLGIMMVFLALNSLFPEMWLWLRLPGVFLFEAVRAASSLVRCILFVGFLFISSVLITLGVESDGSRDRKSGL